MGSAWIQQRITPAGQKRYRVRYRTGGRETKIQLLGSFKTKVEAEARRSFVAHHLAAGRDPRAMLHTIETSGLTPEDLQEILELLDFQTEAFMYLREQLSRLVPKEER